MSDAALYNPDSMVRNPADRDSAALPGARTLLVSENFPPTPGGSGRWFWEIYRRMPRERFFVLAGNPADAAAFDRAHGWSVERTDRLTMNHWGIARPRAAWNYLQALRAVRRIVRRERIERLHVGRTLPEGVVALGLNYLCGLRYLCYVHGEDVTMAATSRELSALVRRVLARAERVIANSHNTRRMLLEDWQLPEAQVVVMHPGVDTQRFIPAEPDASVRERLGWSGRRVLLTVGRLQRRKGHDHLIEALPAIRRRVPDVLYSIVSDGEERPRLEQLVDRLELQDHVQFRGRADDDEIIRCYQQCDLFILPNRTEGVDIEGFGMVLLEAQACGRPVMAGDSGGTRETMRVGETGIVIPCDDPAMMVEPVAEMLLDAPRRAAMGAAGRQWVEEYFEWDRLAEQAVEIFAAS